MLSDILNLDLICWKAPTFWWRNCDLKCVWVDYCILSDPCMIQYMIPKHYKIYWNSANHSWITHEVFDSCCWEQNLWISHFYKGGIDPKWLLFSFFFLFWQFMEEGNVNSCSNWYDFPSNSLKQSFNILLTLLIAGGSDVSANSRDTPDPLARVHKFPRADVVFKIAKQVLQVPWPV